MSLSTMHQLATRGGRRPVRAYALVIAVAASLASASTAFAFETEATSTPTGRPCISCHGDSGETSGTIAPTRKGPHGGYTTGTAKCESCHFVHGAPHYVGLLPAQTIRDTCEMCHDGTGGKGVYGAIEARTGQKPKAMHRIEVTNVVPSGSASGDTTMTFSGENGYLTCSDCHSPHNNDTVQPFIGDRLRGESDVLTATPTSRLLKRRPGGSDVAVDVYGSSWCGACHAGSVETTNHVGLMGDHPVETETAGFSYNSVVWVTGVDTTETAMGQLGGSNFGYVLPHPRSALQAGHGPVCQQCHEDARSVGDDLTTPFEVKPAEVFRVSAPDGADAADSPRFQTFPHESDVKGMVIESEDDLCLNCHPAE